ncbi:MAG: LamG domain-containing protein [Opitutus sp.]|nr:LamG domain-containing protein [Opitutus sp.]
MRLRFSPALIFLVAVRAFAAVTVWRMDNVVQIDGHALTVAGAPWVSDEGGGKAVWFDGVKDGLWIPVIPFAGSRQFTIEILFLPEEGGPTEQRFLHAQDTQERRALIETRLDGKGGWWLDTYIVTDAAGRGVTLADPTRVHPTGRWYWAALRYDGKTMAHFVNGRKELEHAGEFDPFGVGQISLGVRQNKIHWFKGAIREVRFHSEPVAEERLQRVK